MKFWCCYWSRVYSTYIYIYIHIYTYISYIYIFIYIYIYICVWNTAITLQWPCQKVSSWCWKFSALLHPGNIYSCSKWYKLVLLISTRVIIEVLRVSSFQQHVPHNWAMTASWHGNAFHITGPCEVKTSVNGGVTSQSLVIRSFHIFVVSNHVQLYNMYGQRWFEAPRRPFGTLMRPRVCKNR